MRYFFLLLLIVASIGIFVALVVPRYQIVQATRADVAAYTADLATATQLQQSRQSLIAQYNTIQKSDLDNIQTLLPDSVDNIRLIIQMNALATKDGLSSLRSVDYNADDVSAADSSSTAATSATDPTANLPYGQFVMSFQTSGQYSNFLSFLSDLQQNLRLIDVTNIVFTEATDANGNQTVASGLTYKVTLTTYWLKQ
jgi:Tfp pilus assembly protein PilO